MRLTRCADVYTHARTLHILGSTSMQACSLQDCLCCHTALSIPHLPCPHHHHHHHPSPPSHPLPCSDPEDKQIQRELRALKALIREEKAESAKVFKGALGAPPKPKPSSGADSSSGSGDGAAAAAAAAAGGAAEIDEAAAAGGLPAKAAAMRSSSSSSPSQVLLAAAVLLIAALLAFVFGWLPGTGA